MRMTFEVPLPLGSSSPVPGFQYSRSRVATFAKPLSAEMTVCALRSNPPGWGMTMDGCGMMAIVLAKARIVESMLVLGFGL